MKPFMIALILLFDMINVCHGIWHTNSILGNKMMVGVNDEMFLYNRRASIYNYDHKTCDKVASVTKPCTSWNIDLVLDENSSTVLRTNYKARLDDYIKIDWNEDNGFDIRYTFGEQFKHSFLLNKMKHMNIYYNYTKIAYYNYYDGKDKNDIRDNEVIIRDANDDKLLYMATTNHQNLHLNPCRTSIAGTFYTVDVIDDSVVPKEIAMVAIVTHAFESAGIDLCTSWTLIGRWILLSLVFVLIFLSVYYLALRCVRQHHMYQIIRDSDEDDDNYECNVPGHCDNQ